MRMIQITLAGLIALGILVSEPAMSAASRDENSENQGNFLITKDKIKIPKAWGRLVTIHRSGELTLLFFEDPNGTIRQVHYSPERGIPGAVYQIERQ